MKELTGVTGIGIGVSQARLEISVLPSGEGWSVVNSEDEITTLVKQLRKLRPEIIVIEPTAGLERTVVGTVAPYRQMYGSATYR